MPVPAQLEGRLRLPVVAAPMFIVSGPELVLAQCRAGIVGSFPSLNARPVSMLDEWLARITETLAADAKATPDAPPAPFAVNLIVHHTNNRLEADLELCAKYRVPLIITSLRAPGDVAKAVHAWGGAVFHDVIGLRHAEKAAAAGVDGLIAVCAGAGGHAGTLSPFALVSEIRQFFPGTIVLSGAITTGRHVLAAQAIGADLAYVGTRFIATNEANALPEYKQMLVEGSGEDLVYTSLFSGVKANYLKASIRRMGLDPDNLPEGDPSKMNFATGGGAEPGAKAWRDIWGAGQGIGSIDSVEPVAAVVAHMAADYHGAADELAALARTYAR
jgi:nitronate monooxygenase